LFGLTLVWFLVWHISRFGVLSHKDETRQQTRMSTGDRLDLARDVIDELPLAFALLGCLAASFFVGTIVGAEAMASGKVLFNPTIYSPGVLARVKVTDEYLQIYRTSKTVLWVITVGVFGAVFARGLVED
jgi:hypothetical protein